MAAIFGPAANMAIKVSCASSPQSSPEERAVLVARPPTTTRVTGARSWLNRCHSATSITSPGWESIAASVIPPSRSPRMPGCRRPTPA